MTAKNFDPTLINLLKEEVEKEKWRNKLRISGVVVKKRMTKKGSIMLAVKTRKSEYDLVVPKFRKNEFGDAESVKKGEFIKVIGDKSINVVFCDRIEKLNKPIKLDEYQCKLGV